MAYGREGNDLSSVKQVCVAVTCTSEPPRSRQPAPRVIIGVDWLRVSDMSDVVNIVYAQLGTAGTGRIMLSSMAKLEILRGFITAWAVPTRDTLVPRLRCASYLPSLYSTIVHPNRQAY